MEVVRGVLAASLCLVLKRVEAIAVRCGALKEAGGNYEVCRVRQAPVGSVLWQLVVEFWPRLVGYEPSVPSSVLGLCARRGVVCRIGGRLE